MTDFILPAPLPGRYIKGILIGEGSPDFLKVWVENNEEKGWFSKTLVGHIDLIEKKYLPHRFVEVKYVELNRYVTTHLRTIITMHTLAGSIQIRMVNK